MSPRRVIVLTCSAVLGGMALYGVGNFAYTITS